MSYDLTNLNRPVVVFEIDEDTFRGHARFMRYIDERRVMGDIAYAVETGTGHWEGVNSTCYVMNEDDFHYLMRRHGLDQWVGQQDAFLYVEPNLRGRLVFNYNETDDITGDMMKVNVAMLAAYDGFTILKSGQYVMNPDV